jgi:two-component system, LytTR family, response regulator LytT
MDYVFIKSGTSYYGVDTNDIYFIEGIQGYRLIHTSDNTIKTLMQMQELEEKLPGTEFMRIHKSYMVRIDKISYIDYPHLMVKNKVKMLQIGATYKESLFRKINIIS